MLSHGGEIQAHGETQAGGETRVGGGPAGREGRARVMARRADEAADCLSKFEIDLVLTDIVMPGRGGLVLAEQVATQFPHVPILLMTGYAPGNLRDVAWPHITKPFAPTELLTRVRRLLDERTP